MKKKKEWRIQYGDMEERKQCSSASIITPEGKSVFNVNLDNFWGISNHMAERMVELLNKGEKA